jgi:hypothetical protein
MCKCVNVFTVYGKRGKWPVVSGQKKKIRMKQVESTVDGKMEILRAVYPRAKRRAQNDKESDKRAKGIEPS